MSDLPILSSSPHAFDRLSTGRMMWAVSFCLMPAAAWGLYVFGLSALRVMLTAILVSLVSEFVMGRINGRFTLADGSAFLTGLLIGMSMPPNLPLFIPAIASVFAIVVVKWSFGGLGSNWMNPALAGRVFVYYSWNSQLSTWQAPRTLSLPDGISSASPLTLIKEGILGPNGNTDNPLSYLESLNYPHSNIDIGVTSWLNDHLLSPLGIHLPNGYVDPFLGNISGSIGEVSAVLLLLGTIYLFSTGIITWEVPFSFFSSFMILMWIFGGLVFDTGFFSGDILFHLFTGGIILAGFYMATDPVSSPHTSVGLIIYGTGVGILTFLFRLFGSHPAGVAFAILIMNIFVPLINKYTAPERFGRETRMAKKRGVAQS